MMKEARRIGFGWTKRGGRVLYREVAYRNRPEGALVHFEGRKSWICFDPTSASLMRLGRVMVDLKERGIGIIETTDKRDGWNWKESKG